MTTWRRPSPPDRAAARISQPRVCRAGHPIPIQERKFGFRVALVADRSLLAGARFVLAAQAEVDSQTLRNRFPTQIKVGPIDKIQELVKLALPGIALRPMPTPPLEIPYHAASTILSWTEGANSGSSSPGAAASACISAGSSPAFSSSFGPSGSRP
jgi:predicted component of type VI protein secretion system